MTQTSTDWTGAGGKYAELTEKVIGVFYSVYRELGYGFLEAIYQEAMRMALLDAGLQVETQLPIKVHFRGVLIGTFKADLVVNGQVLLELKAVGELMKDHHAQTLNYLRATTLEVGLLLNFGRSPVVKRLAMDNQLKRHG